MRAQSLLVSALCFAAASLQAADWPSWRGPNGDGVSADRHFPTEWSKEKNIAWKTLLPGKGASSAIVSGGRVYATSQTEDTGLHVVALNRATGAVAWDQEVTKGKLKSHQLHNMATPTPVSDGRHIWVLFGTGDLACLDLEGKTVWQRNLVKEYGDYKFNHGYGSSPILLDGRLYVVCMHQGPSYVLAMDAATGKNLWKKDRNLGPTDEGQDSYSTPVFLKANGKTQLVMEGAEAVTAYDPATGEQQWSFGGLKAPHPYGRTIAGVAPGEGALVVVTSGFQNRGYTLAVNPSGHGDVTGTHKLWTQAKFAPDCATPVVYQGKVYTIRDDGMASCLDLKTGEAHWQERLFTDNVKVSPVAADGKIYFTSNQANSRVVKAGEKFEILAQNTLNDPTLASPAFSGSEIFQRTESAVYCIRQ